MARMSWYAILAITLLVTAASLMAETGFARDEDAITGLWLTEDGKAKIAVYRCGENYCGKIAWLGMPMYPRDDSKGMGGEPRVDRENPDPALRRRPLLGMQIMGGFRYSDHNSFGGGTIYDPESGNTYNGKIKVVSPHRLELRGYVGIPLFGRTTTWTR